jgi:predicted membrane protein
MDEGTSVERPGPAVLPSRFGVRAICGSVELDLRRAELPHELTEITVQAVCGSVELELPDHVDVECVGTTFLGSFSQEGGSRRSEDRGQTRPRVRILGRSVFSSVEVEGGARV